MKIRQVPENLNDAMQLNENFSYMWCDEKATALFGLGDSFYFEYLEHFIYAVSKYWNRVRKSELLEYEQEIFLKQERLHGLAHKKLNEFVYQKSPAKEKFNLKVYDFLYTHYKTFIEPMMLEIDEDKNSDLTHNSSMHSALHEIAIFESTSCISGLAFFEHFFDNNKIEQLINSSKNLPIAYLLAYHMVEELEHCYIAHDMYEEICGKKVWNQPAFEYQVRNDIFSDIESINSSLHAARLLGVYTTLKEIKSSAFYQLTKEMQTHYIKENFHPNNLDVKERRAFYIHKWDTEWEPMLRDVIPYKSAFK